MTPVAIVTGGSGGLGRATCEALAARGHSVVVVARTARAVAEAAASLPEATGLALDVRDPCDMAEMAEHTLERYGRIDALVTCAGIGRGAGAGLLPRPAARLGLDEWTEVVQTNLTGVFLANRAVLGPMLAAGSGDIVNVVSARGGRAGQPYAAAYSASKRGTAAFSAALAGEVAAGGVRVQLLFPDAIDTPLLHGSRIAGERLAPEAVGELIADMLALPRDCRLDSPLVRAA